MTKDTDECSFANDNRLTCFSGRVGPDAVSARLKAVLDELSAHGAADEALIETLFSSMAETVLRSEVYDENDPEGRHALGRYNQLSRISGELEGLKAVLWREWVERLSKA